MEDKLKGLFGGGEAEPDAAPSAAKPDDGGHRGGGGGRRGGGGGGRRRRRFSEEETAQAEDFIQRYTTGHPSEGFTSEEAVNYLRHLHGEVPPEVMQRAVVQTVQNLPADQRKEFAEMLQRRQTGTGMVTIERTGQSRATEGRGGAAANAGGGGMDDMLGGLLGSLFGGQPEPQSPSQPQSRQAPQAPGGMDDMLGGLLGSLLGGGMAAPAPGGSAQASDPFGDLLGGLLGGGMSAPEPDPRSRKQPQAQPQAQQQEQGGGIGDILGSPLGKAVLGGIAAFAMKEMMDKSRKS